MFLVNLIIILVYIMLAMLSRKHFSKYKKTLGKGWFSGVFYAMGESLCISKNRVLNHVNKNLRKCQVVSGQNLTKISRKYMSEQIGLMLAVFFIFNLISGIYCLYRQITPEEKENIIVRDDYGGKENTYELILEKDGKLCEYTMAVFPVEYTAEEVLEKAEDIYKWLETVVQGENPDLQHISKDLYFPECDEDGVFEIKWDSDNPLLVTRDGRLVKENINDNDRVTVFAKISYLDYSFEKEFTLCLESDNGENMLAKAGLLLDELEKESRNSKTLELPESIQGVNVDMAQKKDCVSEKIMLTGVVFCGCILFAGRERLRNAGKKRDRYLQGRYPAFVNRLFLLLGTGMTIKNALLHYTDEAENGDILSQEIEYTLNQIKAGVNEISAYEELGHRLLLPEYIRLMNQIAHNLKRGNSDLLNCMEDEVRTVLINRKEYAKKIGEEASSKLLFPMIILMLITMVIVMAPALFGF